MKWNVERTSSKFLKFLEKKCTKKTKWSHCGYVLVILDYFSSSFQSNLKVSFFTIFIRILASAEGWLFCYGEFMKWDLFGPKLWLKSLARRSNFRWPMITQNWVTKKSIFLHLTLDDSTIEIYSKFCLKLILNVCYLLIMTLLKNE